MGRSGVRPGTTRSAAAAPSSPSSAQAGDAVEIEGRGAAPAGLAGRGRAAWATASCQALSISGIVRRNWSAACRAGMKASRCSAVVSGTLLSVRRSRSSAGPARRRPRAAPRTARAASDPDRGGAPTAPRGARRPARRRRARAGRPARGRRPSPGMCTLSRAGRRGRPGSSWGSGGRWPSARPITRTAVNRSPAAPATVPTYTAGSPKRLDRQPGGADRFLDDAQRVVAGQRAATAGRCGQGLVEQRLDPRPLAGLQQPLGEEGAKRGPELGERRAGDHEAGDLDERFDRRARGSEIGQEPLQVARLARQA